MPLKSISLNVMIKFLQTTDILQFFSLQVSFIWQVTKIANHHSWWYSVSGYVSPLKHFFSNNWLNQNDFGRVINLENYSLEIFADDASSWQLKAIKFSYFM